MIPEGWGRQVVGELFVVQLGKMLNKEAKQKHPQFPYLTNFNIRWGSINIEELNTMYFSEKDREKFALKRGDLILCEGGEVGRCAIWDENLSTCYYQKALHRLRPKADIIPRYFQAYMESIAGTKLLEDYTSRTSIAHLTREKLLKLPVLFSPLPEQKKIAQILATWDKAIETVEKLIANSQQKKKALMQQLLTGKKRFPGFDGEWKKMELGKLLDYKQPTPFLVKSTKYSDEYATPVLTAGKTFILGHTNESFGVYEEDLPVIIFDDFTTASKFVDFPFKAKSSAMKMLTAKQGVSIKYIFEAMQMINYSVGGHQRHWISIYSNLVINIPSIEEQQKISSALSSTDQEIKTWQQELEHLKQEKKALMQQLLTGKRRVQLCESEGKQPHV